MSLKSLLQVNKALLITLVILLVVFSGVASPLVANAEEGATAVTEETVSEPSAPEVVSDPAPAVDNSTSTPTEAETAPEAIKDSLSDNTTDQAETEASPANEAEVVGESPENTADVTPPASPTEPEVEGGETALAIGVASTTEPVILDTETPNTASSTPAEVAVDNSAQGLGDNANKPIVDEPKPADPADDLPVEELVSDESEVQTLDEQAPDPIVDEQVSDENSFTTLPSSTPSLDERVSSENSFNTNADQAPTITELVSLENSFTTLSAGGGDPDPDPLDETVSLENNFNTLSDTTPGPLEVVSSENNFTTLSDTTPTNPEIVSEEMSFNTLSDNGGDPDPVEVVSEEVSFTTLSDINIDEQVSPENDFTTLNDDGGCTENCGGGGGGGGGGRRHTTTEVLPSKCIPLLYKYIRLGYDNDPYEVFKLQWFLNNFEGFNLQLNGVYDQPTFEAVKIFQKRHERDVLNTWGITDATGYVYVTTTLMVNYIYCGIDEPIRLELDLPAGVNAGRLSATNFGGNGFIIPTPSADTDSLEELDIDLPLPVVTKGNNFLQAVAVGFLNFFEDLNICQILALLVSLLLLLVLWLLYKLFRLEKDNDLLRESNDMMIEAHNEMVTTAVPFAVFEDEQTEAEADEDTVVAGLTEAEEDQVEELVSEYNDNVDLAEAETLAEVTGDDGLGLGESTTDQTIIPLNGESKEGK